MLTNSENNGTEEFGLVTPISGMWDAFLCHHIIMQLVVLYEDKSECVSTVSRRTHEDVEFTGVDISISNAI